MADPIPLLNLVPRAPDEALVRVIADLLHKAQNGEIRGLAFATVGSDGPGTHWYNGTRSHDMMAAIAHLQWRYHYDAHLEALEGAPDGA